MSVLNKKIVSVTAFSQNCSIIWDNSKIAAVIDPGGDLDKIITVINNNNLKADKIILTHGHVDHVGGAYQLSKELDIPILGPHIYDKFWLDLIEEIGRVYGFSNVKNFIPNKWLSNGDKVFVGDIELDVIHCPGHTPGHIVFYHNSSKLAFVGDVIFQGSIGRTDFPKGDHAQLIYSIKNKLFPLGNEVQFIPGHGSNSTFGHEMKYNPFLQD